MSVKYFEIIVILTYVGSFISILTAYFMHMMHTNVLGTSHRGHIYGTYIPPIGENIGHIYEYMVNVWNQSVLIKGEISPYMETVPNIWPAR